MRIQQYVDANVEQILWFRSARSPLTAWVRPRALLITDVEHSGIQQEHINLMCGDFLRMNRLGAVRGDQITPATLIKLPYRVSFWEDTPSYICYTVYPEWRLPWEYTIRSSFRLPVVEDLMPAVLPRRHAAPPEPAPTAVRSPRVDERPRRLSEGAMCPITWEPLVLEETLWTPCSHAFSHAILRALETDPRCPLCRAACNVEDVLR